MVEAARGTSWAAAAAQGLPGEMTEGPLVGGGGRPTRDAGDGRDEDGYIFFLYPILCTSHGFVFVWAFDGLITSKQMGLDTCKAKQIERPRQA